MSELNQHIAELDPEVAAVLDSELVRQREYLEMIASEHFVPRAVLEAQGSVVPLLLNKVDISPVHHVHTAHHALCKSRHRHQAESDKQSGKQK